MVAGSRSTWISWSPVPRAHPSVGAAGPPAGGSGTSAFRPSRPLQTERRVWFGRVELRDPSDRYGRQEPTYCRVTFRAYVSVVAYRRWPPAAVTNPGFAGTWVRKSKTKR